MVLRPLALAIVLIGCSQSLFDQYPAAGAAPDPEAARAAERPAVGVPVTVPRGRGGDFGMPASTGAISKNARSQMGGDGRQGAMEVGTDDPANTISACSAGSAQPTCAALPDALLVSSSGSGSTADPAIEWTATTNQIVAISSACSCRPAARRRRSCCTATAARIRSSRSRRCRVRVRPDRSCSTRLPAIASWSRSRRSQMVPPASASRSS